MRKTNSLLDLFLILAVGLALSACGTKTGTGHGLTVKSEAFSTSGIIALSAVDLLPRTLQRSLSDEITPRDVFAGAISDFKFCVTKVKLEAADGSSSGEIEFKLGLIDVSNGASKTWGTSPISTSFSLSRLRVEVHKDPELCSGADYSVKFNSVSATQDVEFRFLFDPAVTVTDGDEVSLSLAKVANVLRAAADQGSLTNENLKDFVEQVEESGTK